MYPLVEEAMRKAAVAWLAVPGGPGPYPVWCAWLDGALYLVAGTGEQPAPGLAGGGTVQVTARGDHGGQIVRWPARVGVLGPGDARWDTVVPHLAGRRLNAPGGPAELALRWAGGGVTVYELIPATDVTG